MERPVKQVRLWGSKSCFGETIWNYLPRYWAHNIHLWQDCVQPQLSVVYSVCIYIYIAFCLHSFLRFLLAFIYKICRSSSCLFYIKDLCSFRWHNLSVGSAFNTKYWSKDNWQPFHILKQKAKQVSELCISNCKFYASISISNTLRFHLAQMVLWRKTDFPKQTYIHEVSLFTQVVRDITIAQSWKGGKLPLPLIKFRSHFSIFQTLASHQFKSTITPCQ